MHSPQRKREIVAKASSETEKARGIIEDGAELLSQLRRELSPFIAGIDGDAAAHNPTANATIAGNADPAPGQTGVN